MRQLLIFILLLSSQTVFCQYKLDSTVKKEYLRILKKFPQEFKDEIATEYKERLSLLYDAETDTLNKKDLKPDLNSVKIHDIDPITGEVDSLKTASIEQEQINRKQPFPLSCSCSF